MLQCSDSLKLYKLLEKCTLLLMYMYNSGNRYLITIPDWIGVLPLDANKYTSQFGLRRPNCEGQLCFK